MIDEKKIEEAAEKECGGLVLAKEGFKTGINWFKENLWHDASEEPKDNSTVVVIAKFDDEPYTAFYSHSFEAFNGEGVFQIKDVHHDDNNYLFQKDISKWLYIEDLLKGGE